MDSVPVLSAVKPPPTDSADKDEKVPDASRPSSFVDEKNGYVDEKIAVASSDIGDVFAEGPRLIDLGEDGKERPIETDADYSLRLISLEDDPTLPIFTFRLWFLGLGLACFGAVLGQIFYFRPQTVTVSQLFLLIISYMLGRVLEEIVPGPGSLARIKTPDNRFWRFMNPGPFNLKEHVAITIMASTASASATAISIFAAQDLYYNVRPNAAVGIFTLIGSQLIGYGTAGSSSSWPTPSTTSRLSLGIMRIFLVYPTFAVYPQLMPNVQLFETLHRGHEAVMQRKRLKFFWIIFVGIFAWEWFPQTSTLTGISIFCLANQKSAWFTRVFGGAAGNEGLGAFSLCLDWAYVGAGGGSIGALFTPLATQLSLYAGCAVCMIAFCACYAMNVWNTQNFPFLTQLLYYEDGREYDQLSILNDDFTLNLEKLAEQGLPWYAASQLLYKVSRTIYIGAAVMHFLLWHSKTIYNIFLDSRKNECQDPHYQKMKGLTVRGQVYREISNWWYFAIFIGTFGMAIGTTYGAKSGLPWWALIVALMFAWLFVPIIGTLYATVGYAPSIENMVQMLGGALVPGKPVANMYFTLYGYNTVTQALALLQDLKLGQYTKLPPVVTFVVQAIGTVIGGLLNFLIMKTVLNSQREILKSVQGTNVWSGQQRCNCMGRSGQTIVRNWDSLWSKATSISFAYSTLLFSAHYQFVPYMLIAGLGFPIPFWLLHKKFPKFGWNKVFTPILVASTLRYRATWFRKYNFLMSAALDGGTSVMIFVWTFAVGGGSGTVRPFPNWALNPTGNPDYCKRLT
ncbi:hypothetical protein DXG01_007083 [Tephrocybe rancida]|nr:hypothetical protein DXG01_007083 [Tephrocybe rancida]